MVKLFWWRVIFLGGVALVQFSFLNTLFPTSSVPGLVLSVIAALVIVRGFRTSLFEWLPLLVFYDVLRVGQPTTNILVGIFVAYSVSFVSRRFVIEHSGMGVLLLGFLVAGVSVAGGVLFSLWSHSGAVLWSGLFLDFGIIVFGYLPLFLLVQWFEKRVQDAHRAEFRGLRHA